jgi:IS30 family transposase
MRKLVAVEQARKALNEGKEWSIWRWLFEKKRVRTIADAGTAALDELEREVKAGWHDDLWHAYRELEARAASEQDPKAKRQYEKAKEKAKDVAPAVKLAIRKVKEADDIATDARLDAEAAFAEAERRLSGGLAREGAQKAIDAYDVREKAIRKAEAAGRLM